MRSLPLLLGTLLVMSLTACLPREISSFEECREAGYPILESFPEQCRTPDGRTFMRETGAEAMIRVDTPTPGAAVSGTVTVRGEARGSWFFEASFPIELLDAEGNILLQTYAQTQEEWMTTNFIPFVSEFTVPETEFLTGSLVLRKDNPSGLPEHDAAIVIPVRFSPDTEEGAAEGQMCGGIAGLPCAERLECILEGNYPDAAGTCVRKGT